ncbi:N-acetyltransferase [Odoribacter laneus]|jgi:acetyltransferase|uniref:GNAT family N-acetyltransferase n=1 Tax=Odoribacter laneus TaxID=626933 RepID=UPI001896C5DC|nr:GNAT family N-acetyltransferase [Odoribacter laneus]GKI22003.1 N-acetyltransferase [Odoribacter laneus]GKI24446.1 N-acetyltransferase [Odoribacter laneus]
MELRRITQMEDPQLPEVIVLYQQAFPASERREVNQLKRLIAGQSSMFFHVIEEGGKLAGLFVYWKLADFYYLEHLAVCPEMRNQKIGQKVLDYIREHLSGEHLLEVEPAVDEITTRRINYYRRNGYEIVEKQYRQPAYDNPEKSYPLWLMSNRDYPDRRELAEHIQVIKEEVYYKPCL